jgi:hypothetical protein
MVWSLSSLEYLNEVYNEALKLAEDERVVTLMKPWVFRWEEDVPLEDVKGGIRGYLFAMSFPAPQTCPICFGKIFFPIKYHRSRHSQMVDMIDSWM